MSRNITFEIAHLTTELRQRFDETGLSSLFGPSHFYPTVRAAVDGVRHDDPGRAAHAH
jgi:hypothetical protein